MPSRILAAVGVAVFGSALSAQSLGPSKPTRVPATAASAQPKSTLVQQYCVGCHSDKGKAGGLTLASYDPAHADQQAEVTERMIRKLRAGMMPPPGSRRPEPGVLNGFVTSLESTVDTAAAVKPGIRRT